ncbi:hypothetical protein [Intestinimonas butyriciproducens]|uniref:hypothetical protein n=1 Tax=Intestinimonas butyriciproducens TaxID=1297617 RepID=UPI001959EC94|nr:hypothetical protein [Intestinimonas butyriciproducens]MBM6919086.1 hypothetical protein [Intestinimonas butyriciproducens]
MGQDEKSRRQQKSNEVEQQKKGKHCREIARHGGKKERNVRSSALYDELGSTRQKADQIDQHNEKPK